MTPRQPEPVVGGPDDPRPQKQWHPDDGLVFWPTVGRKPRRQCCAHSKQKRSSATTTGKARCLAAPSKSPPGTPERRVCRLHGGENPPPGADHPTFKNGRHSRVLRDFGDDWRTRLREDYIDGRARPMLLDGGDSVSAMDAIIMRLWERFLAEADSPAWRESVQAGYEDVIDAAQTKNTVALSGALAGLGKLINQGCDEDGAMMRLFGLEERRTTAAAKAAKVRIQAERVYTSAQLVALFREFLSIIWARLPRPQALDLVEVLQSRLKMRGAQALIRHHIDDGGGDVQA